MNFQQFCCITIFGLLAVVSSGCNPVASSGPSVRQALVGTWVSNEICGKISIIDDGTFEFEKVSGKFMDLADKEVTASGRWSVDEARMILSLDFNYDSTRRIASYFIRSGKISWPVGDPDELNFLEFQKQEGN